MIFRSAQTSTFSKFEASLQQSRLQSKQHPWPHPLRSSWAEDFTRWLLLSGLVLFGYLALIPTGAIHPAQGAATLEAAGQTASGAAQGNQVAGGDLFQTYTAWLQTSHAQAFAHAQDEALPNQF